MHLFFVLVVVVVCLTEPNKPKCMQVFQTHLIKKKKNAMQTRG